MSRCRETSSDGRSTFASFVRDCQLVIGTILGVGPDIARPQLEHWADRIPTIDDPVVACQLRLLLVRFAVEIAHRIPTERSNELLHAIAGAETQSELVGAFRTLLFLVPGSNRSSSNDGRVAAAQAYIEAHISNSSLRLAHVAQHVGLSPSHLDRILRRELGIGFATLVRDIRIAQACHLLEEGKMSVKEIAFAVGYKFANELSRQFRAAGLCQPSACRRSAKIVR